MRKRILVSFFVSIIPSLLLMSFVSGRLAERAMSNQRGDYDARGIFFGEPLVSVGYPLPYSCYGLCVNEIQLLNLFLDILIFLLPLWGIVYMLFYLSSKKKPK